jgi:hypothetical protein
MLIDGIGLGIIAVCTLFEGLDDWDEYLRSGLTENPETIIFWFCGLLLAIAGLLFLIFNAASFEAVHDFEIVGMAMLTTAPIVNMCAWSIFDAGLDPTHFYNKQWLATEVIEFAGMSTLCLSYLDMDRSLILAVEWTGFFVLSCAAMLNVNFYPDRILPELVIREDYVHVFDSFGLFLLCIVSYGQWKLKGLEEESASNTGPHGHATMRTKQFNFDDLPSPSLTRMHNSVTLDTATCT